MQIWVDADACPKVIKDILFRAAERLESCSRVGAISGDYRRPGVAVKPRRAKSSVESGWVRGSTAGQALLFLEHKAVLQYLNMRYTLNPCMS